MNDEAPKKSPALAPEELRWMQERMPKVISQLRPDLELYSGRKFFEQLLRQKGAEGVFDFVEKAQNALSEKGELDLFFDFDATERDSFNKARIKYMSRRGFLAVMAVAASGAIFTAAGGLGILRQLDDAKDEAKEQWASLKKDLRPTTKENALVDKQRWECNEVVPPKGTIAAAEHLVKEQLYPMGEVLVGAALINEAYEKRMEIKLEQIADAVTMLDNKLRIEQERLKAAASTAPSR